MASRPQERFVRAVADALDRIGIMREALVLIALSGGPDSVALLHAMLALRERFGYRLAAAHLNHRIRAADSDRDEGFVRELCARVGVDLFVERAEGLSPQTPNLEERAREIRHAFLNRIADRVGADHVALAHHGDDQAETVMLRILRGTGAAGIGAMGERGPKRLIRPMLSVTRAEVLASLDSVGASFVTDASNASTAILRNRIRNELFPMVEREYAPGLRRRLVQLASEMRSLDDFLTVAARGALSISPEGALDLSRFAGLHPALQAAAIREFLENRLGDLRRITRAHIESVRRLCLEGPPNGAVDLPGRVRAVREYGLLRVSRESAAAPRYAVALAREGTTEIPQAGFAFDAAIVPARDIRKPTSKFEALFDARETAAGLVVRNFRPGDRIAPVGMTGRRKLKDIFIDAKFSKSKRAAFPIVQLEGGGIAWVPGLVRGQIALVTEATESVLRVRALP